MGNSRANFEGAGVKTTLILFDEGEQIKGGCISCNVVKERMAVGPEKKRGDGKMSGN